MCSEIVSNVTSTSVSSSGAKLPSMSSCQPSVRLRGESHLTTRDRADVRPAPRPARTSAHLCSLRARSLAPAPGRQLWATNDAAIRRRPETRSSVKPSRGSTCGSFPSKKSHPRFPASHQEMRKRPGGALPAASRRHRRERDTGIAPAQPRDARVSRASPCFEVPLAAPTHCTACCETIARRPGKQIGLNRTLALAQFPRLCGGRLGCGHVKSLP
jgi:hypothetical protein